MSQQKAEEKSNESTAIPEFLELLSINGAIVTIDAMGCQREISQKILDAGADYCLALKENQPILSSGVREFFEEQQKVGFQDCEHDAHETVDADHGRVEQRKYHVIISIDWINQIHKWPGLIAIGVSVSCREVQGKMEHAVRFYLLSCVLTAVQLAEAVRGYCGIENQLHWVLDVIYHDDYCRIRGEYGAENLHVIKQMSLNMLRRVNGNMSLRRRRRRAAQNDAYLEKTHSTP